MQESESLYATSDVGVVTAAELLGSKPPTIRVGVTGIEPAKQKTADDVAADRVDWAHLIRLPAFQMFVAVLTGKVVDDHEALARDTVSWVAQNGQLESLHTDYCVWHAAQGRWPNEDPMGRLIA